MAQEFFAMSGLLFDPARRSARRAALRELVAAFPGRAAALVAACTLAGALPAVFAALVGLLIVEAPAATGHGFGSTAGHRVVLALIGVGVVLVFQEVVSGYAAVASNDLYRRFDAHIYRRLIDLSTRWDDLDLFDDPAKAAQADRANRIASYGPGEFVSGLQTKWTARVTGAAAAVLLVTVVPWYLALAIVVPLTIIWYVLGVMLQASYYQLDDPFADPLRRADYLQRVGLMPQWAKEVRIFGLIGWITDRYSAEWRKVMASMQSARRTDRRLVVWATAVLVVVNAIAVAAILRAGWQAAMSLAQIAVAMQALLMLPSLASQDGDVWIENGAAQMPEVAALTRLVEDRRPRRYKVRDRRDLPQREIAFAGVGFTYPGRDTPVFEHFDLRIAAGTSLAIVGLNGAGKTTLVKLLTGLCRPQHGRITVDGIALADLDPDAWRRQVAVILQDFARYELPARANVGFGAIESYESSDLDERIHIAAQAAGAVEILGRLPNGLETVLSLRFPGGVDLSGGEWQRIALTRALLATGQRARVLVLDEPTAHLDVQAEVDLFDRFLEVTAGLTTVLISHRFSTARRAERIVVLESGQVVEDGSHDELIALGGRYAHMFALQAQRYVDPPESSPDPTVR
jgi:ATP-binding cassette subfamily B protein